MEKSFSINELEISINNVCNLMCTECGFLTPNQPKPTLSNDVLKEQYSSLDILCKNNIEIKSLAVLGGEPTLNPSFLEKSVMAFSSLPNIRQIEVVTNGLTPQGFTSKTLSSIQKISVSTYLDDKEFIEGWKNFVKRKASHIDIAFRVQKMWDMHSGDYTVSDDEAQKLFNLCWYRKHCVTIERSRLFICSISPKHKIDSDGLFLSENTTQYEIIRYLTRTEAISHCRKCVPEMHIKKIPGGMQRGKADLQKMMASAKAYLNSSD